MDKVEVVAKIIVVVMVILFLAIIILLPCYAVYKYGVWSSPCSIVYNNGEIIYEGNSFFYKTESRGNSTIFQEYEKTFFFPKMKKEIMSDKLEIKTCGERK